MSKEQDYLDALSKKTNTTVASESGYRQGTEGYETIAKAEAQRKADEWNAYQRQISDATGAAPNFKAADDFRGGSAVANTAELAKLKESAAYVASKGNKEETFNKGVADIYEQNKFVAPQFDESYVQKWQDTLSRIEAPMEQQAIQKTRAEMNFQDPYNVGGGRPVSNVNSMIQQMVNDRINRATQLGQIENQRDYTQAYSDRTSKVQQALDLLNKQLGRQWSNADLASQRQFENDMFLKQQNLAFQLAEASKPREQQWYEQLLQPVMTGVGYGLGGAIPAAVGSYIGSSGQKSGSYLPQGLGFYNPTNPLVNNYQQPLPQGYPRI
jgi:hypothetical protein